MLAAATDGGSLVTVEGGGGTVAGSGSGLAFPASKLPGWVTMVGGSGESGVGVGGFVGLGSGLDG